MDQDPQMEGEFLAILRSADPSFIKYLPSLEKAGLGPTTTLKDLEDVSDEDLLGALREVEGLPALVAYVVFDAIGRARRDQEKGGPDVAEEKARSQAREKAREWVLARVQVK